MYSKKTQNLIHVLLSSISNFKHDKFPNSKTTAIELLDTKDKAKREYVKYLGYTGKKEPLETFRDDIGVLYDEIIENEPVVANRKILMQDLVTEMVAKELQKFFLMYGDFSVALKLLSQEGANNFVEWLIKYHYDNDIGFKDKTIEYFSDKELEKHVWHCMMKRRCCISGEYGADPHHCTSVNDIGGYDKDDGMQIPFLPLSRQYHNEVHSIGKISFEEKYKVKGILLKYEDVEYLVDNKIYPNQFKAFKKR